MWRQSVGGITGLIDGLIHLIAIYAGSPIRAILRDPFLFARSTGREADYKTWPASSPQPPRKMAGLSFGHHPLVLGPYVFWLSY
jgi:hypothetical protein